MDFPLRFFAHKCKINFFPSLKALHITEKTSNEVQPCVNNGKLEEKTFLISTGWDEGHVFQREQ